MPSSVVCGRCAVKPAAQEIDVVSVRRDAAKHFVQMELRTTACGFSPGLASLTTRMRNGYSSPSSRAYASEHAVHETRAFRRSIPFCETHRFFDHHTRGVVPCQTPRRHTQHRPFDRPKTIETANSS